MDKDLFEEFEFKPLTDGLGFNKKAQATHQALSTSATNLTTDDILGSPSPKASKKKFEDVLATLEKSTLPKAPTPAASSLEFVDALPREPREKANVPPLTSTSQIHASAGITMPTISPFPSMDVYKKMKQPNEAPAIGIRRGGHDSMAPALEAIPVSFSSACLDLIMIFALFLIFLVSLLLVTNVELSSVIHHIENNSATKISMIVLCLTVMQIYVVLSRSFFGRTLGEWTFDMQMGRNEDHKNESYPLRILGRSLLVTATGIITLPILSLIFNQDLAARWTGVQLYRQKI